MRVEATIPDARGKQLDEAARDLGLSRSDLIGEALAVFLTSLTECRRGLRLALVDAGQERIVREIVTPALSQIEWHSHRDTVKVTNAKAITKALLQDAEPTPALRRLMTRRRK
jgi:hypothetical protein